MSVIQRLDFLGVPSQDADRARTFYRDVLGMRPDDHGEYEQWAEGPA
jgi:catechol 2,3-dioxygenase-like lactoylglutathione lyase family enzyme